MEVVSFFGALGRQGIILEVRVLVFCVSSWENKDIRDGKALRNGGTGGHIF